MLRCDDQPGMEARSAWTEQWELNHVSNRKPAMATTHQACNLHFFMGGNGPIRGARKKVTFFSISVRLNACLLCPDQAWILEEHRST